MKKLLLLLAALSLVACTSDEPANDTTTVVKEIPVVVVTPVQETMNYVVVKGDFLAKIAKANDTTVWEIMKLNSSIKNKNLIYPGMELILPNNNK